MFLRKYWLPLSVFLIAIVGVGLYVLQTRPPKPPITILKPVDVETKPKPPPPGQTAESGHWHGDEWHSQPHDAPAPAEVATPEVQGAPFRAQIAQPVNPQLPEQANAPFVDHTEAGFPIPRQEFPARTQAYYDALEKWKAWNDKQDELREEYSQASQELADALPTEEEAKRHENDEQFKREMRRKISEVFEKINEALRKMREHEANRPPIPYTP